MTIELCKYPFNKDCALTFTVDDLHPESANDLEHKDFGYDFTSNFWQSLKTLKAKFPEIVFTLFAVPNWRDRADSPKGILWPLRKLHRIKNFYLDNTFNIALPKYRDWVAGVNTLVDEGLIEIGTHGYWHYSFLQKVPKSQENLLLSKDETAAKLTLMEKLFNESGIKYEKSFRPPGWGLNHHLADFLAAHDYLYIASSSAFKGSVDLEKKCGFLQISQKIYEPALLEEGLYNFVANCYPDQPARAVEIAKRRGVIIVHAHIVEAVRSLKYVGPDYVKDIENMVREIETQTLSHIWFTKLSDLTKFSKAAAKTQIDELKDYRVKITNTSPYDLFGLTLKLNNKTYVVDKIAANGMFILDPAAYPLEPVKVSAILTVYNGAKDVTKSLQSLCDQTYRNLEIIVVNDGSTDTTAQILEKYTADKQDSRIIVINQENQGRSGARNSGAAVATGDILTFCEDDALYDKDYVLNASRHFSEMDHMCGGVIGPHYVWNKKDSITTRVKDLERRRNFIHYTAKSTWFYTKAVFNKLGGFNRNIELAEDVELAIRSARTDHCFIYDAKMRWLHKEPASLTRYLRRKFRGGISLWLLERMGLKKIISVKQTAMIFAIGLGILGALVYFDAVAKLIIAAGSLVLLGLIRWKDIRKVKPYTDEGLLFIIFGIYVEYLWWAATFAGYVYGKTKSVKNINNYLKGR